MAAIKPAISSNPQKNKQIMLAVGIGSVVLVIVLVAAWFADQSASKNMVGTKNDPDLAAVNLTIPGQQLNDKDVWRANEGAKIQSLRKELEDMRLNLKKAESEQNQSVTKNNAGNIPSNEVPMPPLPRGQNFAPGATAPLAPVKATSLPPPPIPVSGGNLPPGANQNQAAPVIQRSFTLEVASDQPATKEVVSNSNSNVKASESEPKSAENYLPAGTFMRVVMLAGLDAPTGGQAQNNPHPVLFRILDPAQLPNKFQANMRDCVVTGNAYGDISSERAYARLDRLSCIDENGGAVDVAIKGYVAGEDGKAGLRGRLVTKQGQALANAFLAGVGSGMGQAFRSSYSTTSQSALGATQTVNDGQELQAGLAQGVSNSMNLLARYYIKLAEQIFPVIEVDGGRVVDVILTRGISIERQ